MTRVNLVDPASASTAVKPVLDGINGAFGIVPDMFRAVADSSPALRSMWGSFDALGAGTLSAKIGEKVA